MSPAQGSKILLDICSLKRTAKCEKREALPSREVIYSLNYSGSFVLRGIYKVLLSIYSLRRTVNFERREDLRVI